MEMKDFWLAPGVMGEKQGWEINPLPHSCFFTSSAVQSSLSSPFGPTQQRLKTSELQNEVHFLAWHAKPSMTHRSSPPYPSHPSNVKLMAVAPHTTLCLTAHHCSLCYPLVKDTL